MHKTSQIPQKIEPMKINTHMVNKFCNYIKAVYIHTQLSLVMDHLWS